MQAQCGPNSGEKRTSPATGRSKRRSAICSWIAAQAVVVPDDEEPCILSLCALPIRERLVVA